MSTGCFRKSGLTRSYLHQERTFGFRASGEMPESSLLFMTTYCGYAARHQLLGGHHETSIQNSLTRGISDSLRWSGPGNGTARIRRAESGGGSAAKRARLECPATQPGEPAASGEDAGRHAEN